MCTADEGLIKRSNSQGPPVTQYRLVILLIALQRGELGWPVTRLVIFSMFIKKNWGIGLEGFNEIKSRDNISGGGILSRDSHHLKSRDKKLV